MTPEDVVTHSRHGQEHDLEDDYHPGVALCLLLLSAGCAAAGIIALWRLARHLLRAGGLA